MHIINVFKTGYRITPVFILAALMTVSCHHGKNPDVTIGELTDHVKYLASDSLKGRATGTDGDSLAAIYIRDELSSYGLKPLVEDGFQRYSITNKVIAGKNNYLKTVGKEFMPDNDFMPFAFSGNSGLEAEIVFAGYGFNINNDSLVWNDYEKIEVKGKWVMILRADPEPEKSVSGFLPFSGDRDKALLAVDMGASGVLMVSGLSSDKEDRFDPLPAGDYPLDIPVLRIKREVADILLAGSGSSVEKLESRIIKSGKSYSFPTGVSVSAASDIATEKTSTRNVVMVLPGEDEILKEEYIIIGAHFDHIGMGGQGSSSRAVDTVAVHYGADDNASGVGVMLELAEKFALTKGSHKRSIIFEIGRASCRERV